MTRRPLGLVVVALLVTAVVLWGAAQGTWIVATWSDPLRGTVVASASGAETEPVLIAWALLALAAVAGLLATATWGRRIIGGLLALAGALATARALGGLSAPSPDALPASARGPGSLQLVEASTVWPLLAGLGALLMTATGVAVVWRAAALPRLGARYERAAGRPADAGRPIDPDKELWDALDAGRDPTAEDTSAAGTPVRADGGGTSTMGGETDPGRGSASADGVGRP